MGRFDRRLDAPYRRDAQHLTFDDLVDLVCDTRAEIPDDLAPDPALPIGRGHRAIALPPHLLMSQRGQRDLSAGTPSAGGYAVAGTTPFVGYAAALRPWSIAASAGVQVVDATAGTPQYSITSTAPTASWVAEGSAPGAGDQTFSAPVAITPSTLIVTQNVSRRLSLTSPTINRQAPDDMMTAWARKFDAAILGAGGSNMPTGLAGVSGRLTQSGTSLTFATLCDLAAQLGDLGVRDDRMSFVATPTVKKVLRTREKFTGAGAIWQGGRVDDIPAYSTPDAPSGAGFLGDFSLIVVAFWGRPTIVVNPYRFSTTGTVELTIYTNVGIGVLRPGCFAHISSIT